MLKVGVIGCGAIAKMHIRAIRQCPNARIVGIADPNESVLKETAEKFGLDRTYRDADQLLREEKPDVVHVLTPPQNHFELTKAALESGCHVFVEKPLAMNAREGEALVALAREKGRQLCVGHSHLFDDVMERARRLVAEGAIGEICGIESYYGFDMDPKYFSAQGNIHWAHQLPGGLLMNRIDHPLSVVIPFMGEPQEIVAKAVDVKKVIPLKIPGELRILISDGKRLATVTCSLAVRPRFHSLTLLGTQGTIRIDLLNKVLVHYAHVPGLPSAISRTAMNLKEGLAVIRATLGNAVKATTGKFHPVEGMPKLIRRFYEALERGGPSPVPPEQGVTAMRIMDETWKQIGCGQPAGAIEEADFRKPKRRSNALALVTGATGFVGRRLVQALLEEGRHDVRVLARNPIRAYAAFRDLPVEVIIGDLAERDRVIAAMEGVDTVYHLGAAMGGTRADYQKVTVEGTRHVVEAALAHRVKRLVHVSSIAVYGLAEGRRGLVKEEAPYAQRHLTDYIWSKIEAEKVVLEAVRARGLRATILRPGNIYGAGAAGRMSRIGFKVGTLYVIIGLNDIELPAVYVGGVVKALMLAGNASDGIGRGQVYNVVDDERVTQTGYIKRLSRYGRLRYRYVFFPYTLVAGMGALARALESSHKIFRKVGSLFSPFNLRTCVKPMRYDTSRIRQELGWQPSAGLEEHFREMASAG